MATTDPSPRSPSISPLAETNEQTMAAALRPFGWQCAPEFWLRYYSDPWVFSLANAVERLTEQLAKAEALILRDERGAVIHALSDDEQRHLLDLGREVGWEIENRDGPFIAFLMGLRARVSAGDGFTQNGADNS